MQRHRRAHRGVPRPGLGVSGPSRSQIRIDAGDGADTVTVPSGLACEQRDQRAWRPSGTPTAERHRQPCTGGRGRGRATGGETADVLRGGSGDDVAARRWRQRHAGRRRQRQRGEGAQTSPGGGPTTRSTAAPAAYNRGRTAPGEGGVRVDLAARTATARGGERDRLAGIESAAGGGERTCCSAIGGRNELARWYRRRQDQRADGGNDRLTGGGERGRARAATPATTPCISATTSATRAFGGAGDDRLTASYGSPRPTPRCTLQAAEATRSKAIRGAGCGRLRASRTHWGDVLLHVRSTAAR